MLTSEEIKQAMRDETPVKYKGVEYTRITAYIFRAVKHKHTGKNTFILQCELLDRCGHSVTVADAGKVEFIT